MMCFVVLSSLTALTVNANTTCNILGHKYVSQKGYIRELPSTHTYEKTYYVEGQGYVTETETCSTYVKTYYYWQECSRCGDETSRTYGSPFVVHSDNH